MVGRTKHPTPSYVRRSYKSCTRTKSMITEHKLLPEDADPPRSRNCVGIVFDNDDYEINGTYLEELVEKADKSFGTHFNREKWSGFVYFKDGEYHEIVKVFGEMIGHLS